MMCTEHCTHGLWACSHLTPRNVKFVLQESRPSFNVLQQPPKHFGLLTLVVVVVVVLLLLLVVEVLEPGSPLQTTLIMTMVFGGGCHIYTPFSPKMPLFDTRLNILPFTQVQ